MKFKRLLSALLVFVMLFSSCGQADLERQEQEVNQSVNEQETQNSAATSSSSEGQTPSDEEQTPSDEESFEHEPEKFGYVLCEYPVPAFSSEEIKEIVISFSANFILTENGEVYSWGLNEGGTLGLGLPLNAMVLNPAKIKIDEPIKELIAGENGGSMIAVGESGAIYGWGWNTLAQFPGVEEVHIFEPIKFDFGIEIDHVALSSRRLTISDSEGNVYVSGNSGYDGDAFFYYVSEYGELPKVGALGGPVGKIKNIFSISNSTSCSAFLTEEGKVFILGFLAQTNSFENYSEPTEIPFPEKIVKLRAIEDGFIALSESGTLYFMGRDTFGIEDDRIDASDETYYSLELNERKEPTAITKLGKKVKDFENSSSSIIVRTEDDEFYTWGYNIGHVDAETDDNTVFEPTQIDIPKDTKYLYMGKFSGVSITEDNRVYAWGSGYYCIYMGDTYSRSHTPRELVFSN